MMNLTLFHRSFGSKSSLERLLHANFRKFYGMIKSWINLRIVLGQEVGAINYNRLLFIPFFLVSSVPDFTFDFKRGMDG